MKGKITEITKWSNLIYIKSTASFMWLVSLKPNRAPLCTGGCACSDPSGAPDKSVLFCTKLSGGATLWSSWYFQQRAETWEHTSTAAMASFLSWGFLSAVHIPIPLRNHSSLPALHIWRLPADSYRFLGKYLQITCYRGMLGTRAGRDEQKRSWTFALFFCFPC